MTDALGGMAGRVVLVRSVLETTGYRGRRRMAWPGRLIAVIGPALVGLIAGLVLGRAM